MTSIKGFVENMLDGLSGKLTDKQTHYLERIKVNAARLTRMIEDLLDLSRIESGRTELRLGKLQLCELVADVIDSLQTVAKEKSVQLTEQQSASMPSVQADRDKVQQVLFNLIGNAIKFTPRGGQVTVSIERPDAQSVVVCVADTGCGIPNDEATRIFEKFYRAASAPPDVRGAGLGLAIAKSLVELHHGQIWVETAPSQGSRFFFSLPLVQPSESIPVTNASTTTVEPE
jgi:signal transduction histidine kinase